MCGADSQITSKNFIKKQEQSLTSLEVVDAYVILVNFSKDSEREFNIPQTNLQSFLEHQLPLSQSLGC